VDNTVYFLKTPSSKTKMMASYFYEDSLKIAESLGAFSSQDLSDFLLRNNLWTSQQENTFDGIKSDIDKLKVNIYENRFSDKYLQGSRDLLAAAKNKLVELANQKYMYDHLLATSIAENDYQRYLNSFSLFDSDDQPILKTWGDFYGENPLLSYLLVCINSDRIFDNDVRALSKLEEWKGIWDSHKHTKSIFHIPSCDLSDNQKSLISWSSFYDDISAHPEKPSKVVISDDDMLDGWVITQNKSQETNEEKRALENRINNSRARNSDMVFVMSMPGKDGESLSPEDIKKIHDMNDTDSKRIIANRTAKLKAAGEVRAEYMPDAQEEIRLMYNQLKMRKNI